MHPASQRILAHLEQVGQERHRRELRPTIRARVQQLKGYQQERFKRTYADLLADPRYRPAALFFLNELYGPEDFTQRDEQFARIVAPLVRLFPAEIVATVEDLAALHSLSERLDGEMAENLGTNNLNALSYVQAWRATGRHDDRARQIDLLLRIGTALDRFTHSILIRQGLKAMRGPARAAGLADLQQFLETGFETFRSMMGARDFLSIVREREERLRSWLFDPSAVSDVTRRQGADPDSLDPVTQLP